MGLPSSRIILFMEEKSSFWQVYNLLPSSGNKHLSVNIIFKMSTILKEAFPFLNHTGGNTSSETASVQTPLSSCRRESALFVREQRENVSVKMMHSLRSIPACVAVWGKCLFIDGVCYW